MTTDRDDKISRILEKFSRLSPDQQETLLVRLEKAIDISVLICYHKGAGGSNYESL